MKTTITTKKKEQVKKQEDLIKKINVVTFCDIKGVTGGLRFHLKKKYSEKKLSIEEWEKLSNENK